MLAATTAWSGTWTPVARNAPGSIFLMLLMPDGTVMAANGGSAWFRLTPDAQGSYVNGTWTTLASMHDSRLYYSSQVLRDGRLFVAGGEYGTGFRTAEVYNPASNTWTMAPDAGQGFSDAISEILPNGNVLIGQVAPSRSGLTIIYDPAANAWIAGPNLVRGNTQNEASWVKLADDSLITVDPFGTNSERYIPSLNRWVNDATVPVPLYDPFGSEIGAGLLLADGRAFFLGSTGHTAYYTPSGTTNAGTWTAGPDIPNGQGTPDAPAAMLVNGRILCAVSPAPSSGNNYPTPTTLYEFDPTANTFTPVTTVNGPNLGGQSGQRIFLDLPDGTVLYCGFSSQLYVYQPTGSPLAAGKPTIASITPNPDGTYHLTGTLLNGISAGAAFGDDEQMNSNFPLVRLTDASGKVSYARTFNWSSTSVMTGNKILSTEFSLPPGTSSAGNSLVVVANGNSSTPVSFTPAALQIQPAGGFSASGKPGGPFDSAVQTFTLTNNGSPTLTWALLNPVSWLRLLPTGGTLTPGGPAASVVASLNPAATNLPPGSYSATVTFTNVNSGQSQARTFFLKVTATNDNQQYATAVQAFNPAGYWRLNETQQPTGQGIATNLGSLGASANGTYQGVPAWVSGALPGNSNQAATISGDYVQVPYINALSLDAPFTIEAWLKPAAVQTTGNFACALACGEFASPRSGWLIYQSSTGWNLRMYNQNGITTSLSIEGGTVPVAGTWYHVAAVYDGSTATIYVNGVGVSGVPTGFVPNVDGALTLGIRSDQTFPFNGTMDEVAIYGSVLSAATVLGHYQNGTNRTPATPYPQLIQAANPLAYFRLDQPIPLPVANNLGTVGTIANGIYEPGAAPGQPGVPYAGLGNSNYSCRLNGLAGYVNVPNTAVNLTGPITLMAWVKANQANGNVQSVLSRGAASYHLDLNENGVPGFCDGQSSAKEIYGTNRVDDGLWHHLAGVYDGAHSQYLYVDGQLAASSTTATTAVAGNANDLWIGGSPEAGPTGIFSGLLDEVAVFTNALSAAQVRQVFDSATTQVPVFQTTSLTGGIVTLSWSAVTNRSYQVQFSTNLASPAWSNLGTVITATNAMLSVTDLATPPQIRFYRVALLP